MSTVTMKLIGAKSFVSRPAGIFNPIYAGDVVEVPEKFAEGFLEQEYRVGKHSRFKLFTTDLDADVILNDVEPMPIEARRELEKDRATESKAVAAANARAEAAEQRAVEFEARMAAMEAKLSGASESGATGTDEVKQPRKRPAKAKEAE